MQIALLTSVRRCAVLRMGGIGLRESGRWGTTHGPATGASTSATSAIRGLGYPPGQQYGYGQQGATDQAKWGTQQQELENQQIQGQMNAFNAPWNNCSLWLVLNPLAQNLQLQTSNQDLMGAYARQGPRSDPRQCRRDHWYRSL